MHENSPVERISIPIVAIALIREHHATWLEAQKT
jgi:hypothetical protein